jgi:hypothetical protein
MSYATPAAPPDVLAASRKASLLMFVLGGLTLFMGTCMLATIIAMPAGQFGQQMQQSAEATGQKMPFTAEQLRIMFITFLAVALMIAAGFIVLGVAVRRGGKTGTVIALVATALMLAFLALQLLSTIVVALQAPAALAVVVMLLIPISLLGLLGAWLIGALRAMSRAGSYQQQYAAQYWQYQQNMQAYAYAAQQQGFAPQGYATAQAPQSPLPTPPPPPPPAAPMESENAPPQR